jgi:ABC-type Na+ efflux pump permease subunit
MVIGSSIFLARLGFQAEFQILKDISLGAMNIFSSLVAIVATAQLIPRDLEERTIYTILAKPVPRYEYLIGKLLGVLLLLSLAILLMAALFLGLLFFREQILLGQTIHSGLPPSQIAEAIASLRASAFNLNLLPGILLIYLKAALLASLTLFVSTFATSNLFTIVVMVFVYFIGHLERTARAYWMEGHSSGWMAQGLLGLVALVFPDLQPFNLIDDVVAGTAIPLALFARTASLGCIYILVYLFFAWASFYSREL